MYICLLNQHFQRRSQRAAERPFPDITFITHPWLFFLEIINLYSSEEKKKASFLDPGPFTASPCPTTVDKNTGAHQCHASISSYSFDNTCLYLKETQADHPIPIFIQGLEGVWHK